MRKFNVYTNDLIVQKKLALSFDYTVDESKLSLELKNKKILYIFIPDLSGSMGRGKNSWRGKVLQGIRDSVNQNDDYILIPYDDHSKVEYNGLDGKDYRLFLETLDRFVEKDYDGLTCFGEAVEQLKSIKEQVNNYEGEVRLVIFSDGDDNYKQKGDQYYQSLQSEFPRAKLQGIGVGKNADAGFNNAITGNNVRGILSDDELTNALKEVCQASYEVPVTFEVKFKYQGEVYCNTYLSEAVIGQQENRLNIELPEGVEILSVIARCGKGECETKEIKEGSESELETAYNHIAEKIFYSEIGYEKRKEQLEQLQKEYTSQTGKSSVGIGKFISECNLPSQNSNTYKLNQARYNNQKFNQTITGVNDTSFLRRNLVTDNKQRRKNPIQNVRDAIFKSRGEIHACKEAIILEIPKKAKEKLQNRKNQQMFFLDPEMSTKYPENSHINLLIGSDGSTRGVYKVQSVEDYCWVVDVHSGQCHFVKEKHLIAEDELKKRDYEISVDMYSVSKKSLQNVGEATADKAKQLWNRRCRGNNELSYFLCEKMGSKSDKKTFVSANLNVFPNVDRSELELQCNIDKYKLTLTPNFEGGYDFDMVNLADPWVQSSNYNNGSPGSIHLELFALTQPEFARLAKNKELQNLYIDYCWVCWAKHNELFNKDTLINSIIEMAEKFDPDFAERMICALDQTLDNTNDCEKIINGLYEQMTAKHHCLQQYFRQPKDTKNRGTIGERPSIYEIRYSYKPKKEESAVKNNQDNKKTQDAKKENALASLMLKDLKFSDLEPQYQWKHRNGNRLYEYKNSKELIAHLDAHKKQAFIPELPIYTVHRNKCLKRSFEFKSDEGTVQIWQSSTTQGKVPYVVTKVTEGDFNNYTAREKILYVSLEKLKEIDLSVDKLQDYLIHYLSEVETNTFDGFIKYVRDKNLEVEKDQANEYKYDNRCYLERVTYFQNQEGTEYAPDPVKLENYLNPIVLDKTLAECTDEEIHQALTVAETFSATEDSVMRFKNKVYFVSNALSTHIKYNWPLVKNSNYVSDIKQSVLSNIVEELKLNDNDKWNSFKESRKLGDSLFDYIKQLKFNLVNANPKTQDLLIAYLYKFTEYDLKRFFIKNCAKKDSQLQKSSGYKNGDSIYLHDEKSDKIIEAVFSAKNNNFCDPLKPNKPIVSKSLCPISSEKIQIEYERKIHYLDKNNTLVTDNKLMRTYDHAKYLYQSTKQPSLCAYKDNLAIIVGADINEHYAHLIDQKNCQIIWDPEASDLVLDFEPSEGFSRAALILLKSITQSGQLSATDEELESINSWLSVRNINLTKNANLSDNQLKEILQAYANIPIIKNDVGELNDISSIEARDKLLELVVKIKTTQLPSIMPLKICYEKRSDDDRQFSALKNSLEKLQASLKEDKIERVSKRNMQEVDLNDEIFDELTTAMENLNSSHKLVMELKKILESNTLNQLCWFHDRRGWVAYPGELTEKLLVDQRSSEKYITTHAGKFNEFSLKVLHVCKNGDQYVGKQYDIFSRMIRDVMLLQVDNQDKKRFVLFAFSKLFGKLSQSNIVNIMLIHLQEVDESSIRNLLEHLQQMNKSAEDIAKLDWGKEYIECSITYLEFFNEKHVAENPDCCATIVDGTLQIYACPKSSLPYSRCPMTKTPLTDENAIDFKNNTDGWEQLKNFVQKKNLRFSPDIGIGALRKVLIPQGANIFAETLVTQNKTWISKNEDAIRLTITEIDNKYTQLTEKLKAYCWQLACRQLSWNKDNFNQRVSTFGNLNYDDQFKQVCENYKINCDVMNSELQKVAEPKKIGISNVLLNDEIPSGQKHTLHINQCLFSKNEPEKAKELEQRNDNSNCAAAFCK